MELMIFSMLVIVVVLMTYLFVEQSVLHKHDVTQSVVFWQNYYDAVANWREAEIEINALLDTAEQAPTWLDKLLRYFR